jgi:hypothetical protein
MYLSIYITDAKFKSIIHLGVLLFICNSYNCSNRLYFLSLSHLLIHRILPTLGITWSQGSTLMGPALTSSKREISRPMRSYSPWFAFHLALNLSPSEFLLVSEMGLSKALLIMVLGSVQKPRFQGRKDHSWTHPPQHFSCTFQSLQSGSQIEVSFFHFVWSFELYVIQIYLSQSRWSPNVWYSGFQNVGLSALVTLCDWCLLVLFWIITCPISPSTFLLVHMNCIMYGVLLCYFYTCI